MKDIVYKDSYKKASGRALYVLAKKQYGSLKDLADFLHVSPQFVLQMIVGSVPDNYAGLLARKHDIPAGILAYESSVCLGLETLYAQLFELECVKKVFSPEDIKYILKGEHVKNYKKFTSYIDSQVLR